MDRSVWPPPPLRNRTREAVEAFIVMAAQEFRDTCVVVSLLPWRGATPPPPELGILLPGNDEDELEFMLDRRQVESATADRSTVLVPCAFEDLEEELAAHRMVPQLAQAESNCIFMVFILPPDLTPSREHNAVIMHHHQAMLKTGVDDVLFHLDQSPQAVRQAISRARAAWELNVGRMRLLLDAEPAAVTEEELQNLQSHHQHLLWESIPHALMPHFPPLARHLVETGTTIGEYSLVRKFDSDQGVVLLATDPDQRSVAIKVIDKAKVYNPGDIESVYREYRILQSVIQHPHIVRLLTMLNGPSRAYLIFQDAGSGNLQQVLASLPGERLDVEVSLRCFGQIAQGLAYCHSRDVCHRNVSLRHIVVKRTTGTDRYHCTLVDFRHAVVARTPAPQFRGVSGGLPCIAPEMALGHDHAPWLADCWSTGVVLLEMAGGLGSLSLAVPYAPAGADLAQVAPLIQGFFAQAGSHGRALARAGGVADAEIESLLQALLQPEPTARAPLRDALPGEGGAGGAA